MSNVKMQVEVVVHQLKQGGNHRSQPQELPLGKSQRQVNRDRAMLMWYEISWNFIVLSLHSCSLLFGLKPPLLTEFDSSQLLLFYSMRSEYLSELQILLSEYDCFEVPHV
jgi:hypothetical protein